MRWFLVDILLACPAIAITSTRPDTALLMTALAPNVKSSGNERYDQSIIRRWIQLADAHLHRLP